MSKLFYLNNNFKFVKETSEYLAPEILKSNIYRQISDQWAYGIILYELLFDFPPFSMKMMDDKIKQQIKKMN